ncbi:MAG: transcription elongation factor NusA [Mycoplasmataceae bacterium RC_NB112A]|nr:MAG: transcription elongation factor NusA [Mycoplasmataceae bacterium RC_NB112A]
MNENKINFPSNFNQILQKLVEAKGVSEEEIKNIICQSFCHFYEKKLNQKVDFHFEFKDKFRVYRLYQIVDKVDNPEKEITSSDPRLKEGRIENNNFFLPLEITDFPHSLVLEIEKLIQQELKKVVWKNQFKLLQKLQQEETLVRGNLQGQQGDYYLVNLNLKEGVRIIGFWEKQEWTFSNYEPKLGQILLFSIKQVSEKLVENQPSLLLTRKSDNFLMQVLKLEIPELKEGIIEVRQILRSPESIKIVVESKKRGVNPIGTCIGTGAVRIKSITRSIFPERIDILPWKKEQRNLEKNKLPSEEIGAYKNIRIRTSEEINEQRGHFWKKKFKINK